MADTQSMEQAKVSKADLEQRLKTLREAKVINQRAQEVIAAQVKKHSTTGSLKRHPRISKSA